MKNVPIEGTERAWIEVDLGALRRNSRVISDRAGDGCRLLPMVKADAYGVGLERVVQALNPLRPWGYGVAATAEGRQLRELGWGGRIVVFAPTLPADLDGLASEQLEPVVPDLGALLHCERVGRSTPLLVHLEVDTGMGRLGLRWDEVGEWLPGVREVLRAGGVKLAGTLTHFHSADVDSELTREQWSRLQDTLAAMRGAGLNPGLVHAANSAAAVLNPETRADLVRPGIYLYGGGSWEPMPDDVVSVRARVLAVRDVPRGATVSYGATWTAEADARLATLAIGYGDGLRRALSGRGRALIHGVAAPIRGVVCMDTVVVDVSGRDDVHAGDVATLLGADGSDRISLSEVAGLCDTIDYEILTGLSRRLPRIELDSGNNE